MDSGGGEGEEEEVTAVDHGDDFIILRCLLFCLFRLFFLGDDLGVGGRFRWMDCLDFLMIDLTLSRVT